MQKKFDMYEMVTKMITERLEAGVIPWKMPWKTGSCIPRNLVSKKMYRGFNFFYLLSFRFERPYFLTWNQVQELGGKVKKGSKTYPVIFWKMLESTTAGIKDPKKIPFLRYYSLFHVDDVEGIDPAKIPNDTAHQGEFDSIAACEEIIERWKDSPVIEHGHEFAAYYPALDKVKIPDMKNFFNAESYFSVLYHELIHSTGNRKRLNRHELFPDHSFASRDYSIEELVAELGASYLCAISGIQSETIDNSAAYIQGWLKKLKSDNKFFLQASTHAQRAADYILGEDYYSDEIVTFTETQKEPAVFEF
jgi:antirestriction protein ArdC